MEYTEMQNKGIMIARQYADWPIQLKINIIAATFGCKTASIHTSPCSGKWRGSSDIYLQMDNGASLPIGNYLTPKAKTAKVQNECINNTLARYNPEIVSELKVAAAAALRKREAADNEIARMKGLKPYTFICVEMNDGSNSELGGHVGWYYVTLAVGDKILAFVETGLCSDIERGTVKAVHSRPKFFVAGGLRDEDVDFVFNNVGHSSTKNLYRLPLSESVRERALQTLLGRERCA